MNWVTIEEAAELEGVDCWLIYKRVERQIYNAKHEHNAEGGPDRVFIDVSELSVEAQRKYSARIRRKLLAERKKRLEAQGEPPWYVGYDIGFYMENYSEKFMKAAELSNVIKRYFEELSKHTGDKTEFCEKFCQEHYGKSSKNFRKMAARYKEGAMWAEICESEDGKNHDYYMILSLVSPPKVGKAIRMTTEISALIENLWATNAHHENLQSVVMLYEDLCRELEAKGSEYIPSYNTVRNYCNKLKSNNSDVAALLKGGVSEFKHKAMHKGRRDTKKLLVMEFVQADAHTFDCWVKHTRENGTITAIRPYLVGFIDTRSRALVGWGICVQPNSEVIEQVLLHMIYPKKDSKIYGVPRVMLLDNGKDFTAETLTGRSRKERFDINGEIKGFYKSIGIEYDKRALPYQPWTKGQIERLFGTICERFSKRFPSYTGTLTGSRTDAKVKKDIDGMLKRNELPDIEAFSAMFETWLEDEYHHRKNEGLKQSGEEHLTPYDVFMNEEKYYRAAPPLDYAISMLGKKEERVVRNWGISINNTEYFSEELMRYIDEKIIVRYTRYNSEYVVCKTTDGEKICTAYQTERLNPLAEEGDSGLVEHIKTQKRQLKRARADIENLRMPYLERDLQVPQMAQEPEKVVSIPQDSAYRERMKKAVGEKASKYKQDKNRELNDFMKYQAEKALQGITEAERKIGNG